MPNKSYTLSLASASPSLPPNTFGRIGAHCSIAGGIHHALNEGVSIDADTIQIFTSNQRRWESRLFTQEELDRWNETIAQTKIRSVMSHSSYLINLGSPDPEKRQKGVEAFSMEIQRCQQLDLAFLNFHPGASLEGTVEKCLDAIVESLLRVEPLFETPSGVRLLLEATAGQGSTVGHRFEHLGYIVSRVKNKIPIGVCIDTCHIFVAGYDIRTPEGWLNTLSEFNKEVGLEHLYAFHVNDSMKELGSHADRHAPLGAGKIGWDSFEFLATHPITAPLPKYLETPEGDALWKGEIAQMRRFAVEKKLNLVTT